MEMYNDLQERLPAHVESEATADEQMETIMVPEDEVLDSYKSSRLPRRYSRRNTGLRKHHGDDGDQADNRNVNNPNKPTKDKNPELDGKDEIIKPASLSSKHSKGSKRKVRTRVETDQTKSLFTCTEEGCRSQFGCKKHVYRHVRTVHRKERPFGCPEVGCKDSFGLKHHMENHVRLVHRNERPFHCSEAGCNVRFGKKGNMYCHVRLVHRGERPFACPKHVCKERFRYKSQVAVHLRAAHGDSKLVCGVEGCKSEFQYVNSLNKHNRKNHKGRG